MSSLQETAFDYEAAVWTCQLLPYRIIACRDRIQYIVQRREEAMYRKRCFTCQSSTGVTAQCPSAYDLEQWQ